MAYRFDSFDARAEEAVAWLGKEFSGIRTGRAAPVLLDTVQAEHYGARVPLSHMSSISVEDARTLRVSPWEAGAGKAIEKAITDADLGVSVVADERGVRVVFPELTSERRVQLLKAAKARLEEARVSLRATRDEVVKAIEEETKGGALTEDEKFRAKDELQKRIDAANTRLEALYEKKENEIQS